MADADGQLDQDNLPVDVLLTAVNLSMNVLLAAGVRARMISRATFAWTTAVRVDVKEKVRIVCFVYPYLFSFMTMDLRECQGRFGAGRRPCGRRQRG